MGWTKWQQVEGDGLDPAAVNRSETTLWVEDREGRPVVLFNSEWAVRLLEERTENVTFRDVAV